MVTKVTNLPQDIDFDLDSYERPEDEVVQPLRIKLGGRVIEMQSPDDFDWKDLLEITNPVHFLKHAVSEDDRVFILNQPIKGWKFNEFMKRYTKHFKIDERMAQARQAERFEQI